MNKTFINISITYYNSSKGYLAPQIYYYRNDGITKISTFDKLTVEKANLLMWELIKLGGKNIYKSNPYDSSICTREVDFWGYL